jgi:hypothetical protein
VPIEPGPEGGGWGEGGEGVVAFYCDGGEGRIGSGLASGFGLGVRGGTAKAGAQQNGEQAASE